jgi:hypothetical protein
MRRSACSSCASSHSHWLTERGRRRSGKGLRILGVVGSVSFLMARFMLQLSFFVFKMGRALRRQTKHPAHLLGMDEI